MSSAKSLTLKIIFSAKSLIYTKKDRGPKTDPCSTSAFTGNQVHDCSLSNTRRNLLLRKILKSVRVSPEIPNCRSL